MPYPYEPRTLLTPYRTQGPWSIEPNSAEWESAGLPCAILRHNEMGHLCGYVGVPPGHPLFGCGSDITFYRKSGKSTSNYLAEVGWIEAQDSVYFSDLVSVHGGITFSQDAKENSFWWFGFDCAHSGDFCPLSLSSTFPQSPVNAYRDWNYVTVQVNHLATQLSAVTLESLEKFAASA